MEAADTITCVQTTPTVTEGPYWVDEKLFRSDIRTDPSNGTVRDGVLLTLTVYVQNLSGTSCTPLSGAYVDIWHCDAKGIYSDESTYNPGGGTGNVNTLGHKFLRGYQITDADGKVQFTTVYPGWYMGRTIHIHMRVRTYSGAAVLSNFVSQIFFDEAVNNVVLSQSAYARSTARDTTNANDNIYRVANASRMDATAAGSVAAGYTAQITVGAAFQTGTGTTPVVNSDGVVSAASLAAGASSGSWVSLFGRNLANAARAFAPTDLQNNTLPVSMDGVSVLVNSKPAFMYYVSPTQINVVAPDDTATGSVDVTVTNSTGTSTAVATTLKRFQPAFFVLSGYVRAVRYGDDAIVNGTGAAEGSYNVTAAAGPGDTLSLYGTGFGPTTSDTPAGQVFTGAYPLNDPITVTIGGVAATVLWAGLVGVGLYQINVTVPNSLADGHHVVLATIGGSSSDTAALLKVQESAKLATRSRYRSDRVWAGARPVRLPAGRMAWTEFLLSSSRLAEGAPHSGCLVQVA